MYFILKRCLDIENLKKYNEEKKKIKEKYNTYKAMDNKEEIKLEKERVENEINKLGSSRSIMIYSIFGIIFPVMVDIYYNTFKNNGLFLIIYLMITYTILCLINAYQNKKLQYYYIAKYVLEELEKNSIT